MIGHDNSKALDNIIEKYFKSQTPKYVEGFEKTANQILAWVESNVGGALNYDQDIPIQFGNLRDSTGLAIYADGQMYKFFPNPIAQAPSEYKGDNVWGRIWLQYAYQQAASQYDDGNVYLVAFSAVPYAEAIEDIYGFFESGVVQVILADAFTNLKSVVE